MITPITDAGYNDHANIVVQHQVAFYKSALHYRCGTQFLQVRHIHGGGLMIRSNKAPEYFCLLFTYTQCECPSFSRAAQIDL